MEKIKQKIKYYYEYDYFNIGVLGKKPVKKINLLLISSLGIILLIIIFYIILYAGTNYKKLDNFKYYTEKYNEGNKAINFNNLNLGLKIMPSYNFEKNILFLKQTKDNTESVISKSKGLSDSYNIESYYFIAENTTNFFPKFKFTKDNVPVGNSILMCVAIYWDELEMGKHLDLMKETEGFPLCTTAKNDEFIWNLEDTKNGLDIPVWTQEIHNANCKEENCPKYCKEKYGGVYVKGVNKKICYSYEILDSICLVIEHDKLRNKYLYHGGCFKNKKAYLMKKPKIDEIYRFSDVNIEIRELSDPIIQAGEWTKYEYNFGENWRILSIINSILVFGLLCLLFYIGYKIYKVKEYIKEHPNDLVKNENSDSYELPGDNLGFESFS